MTVPPSAAALDSLQVEAIPGGAGAALLAHGGAWAIPDEVLPAHRADLREAVEAGRALLQRGAAALDVVTETVAVMEAAGTFDAGAGAMLNQRGEAELDAGVMDGSTRAYGGLMAVKHLRHPVRVARRLLDAGKGEVRLLASAGAERFAEAEGFALVDNEVLVCARERERFEKLAREAEAVDDEFLPGRRRVLSKKQRRQAPGGDTVGCVARDRAGRLAAATSTGGTPFKPPGRVGDSPLPGSGYYATARAAAGATGWGEAIAGVLLSGRAARLVGEGAAPEEAAAQSLRRMHALIQDVDGRGATGGLLVLRADGRGAWAFTTPRMARAGWAEGGEPWVEV